MKKVSSLFLGILLLLCLFAGSAWADGGNLAINGDFEQMASTDLPTGWTYSSWLSDISTFTVYDEGYDGGRCVGIVNTQDNDARFEQTINVKPNTYYRISAYIYSEQCGDTGVAAVMAVANSFAVSNMVRNSDDWVKAELYGKTTEDQTSITIQCRLGWYGMECTGIAYFDQVEVEELSQLPSGVMLQTFDYSNSDYYSAEIAPFVISPTASSSDSSEKEEIRNIYSKWVVVGVLATLAVLLGGSYLKQGDELSAQEKKGKFSRTDIAFAFGIGLALLLRILIALKVSGYDVDTNCFMGWASRMASVGPVEFYLEGFCDYPPLYMLFLGINGLIAHLFGISGGMPFIVLNKLFPICCDLILSIFLYSAAKKETRENMAAFLGLAYAFLPAILINASAWGQIDSVLTLLAVLCLYYMAKERMYLSTLFFAIGIMVKPQMLLFGPIFLIGFILYIVKFKKRGWKDLGLCFLEGLGIVLAVYIPCTIKQEPLWIVDKFVSTMSSYPYASINALNLFGMVGANWVDQNTPFLGLTYATWGSIGMAVSILFAAVLLLKKREGRILPLAAAVMLLGIFFFGVRMHERYYMPAIGLLFLAAVLNRDKRMYWGAALIALPQFINVQMVLHNEHLPTNHRALQIAVCIFLLLSIGYICYVACRVCFFEKQEENRLAPNPIQPTRRLVTGVKFPSLFERGDLDKAKMTRWDVLWMVLITLAYSVLALCNLGDTQAAQTVYHGTYGENVVYDTGESRLLDYLWYYGEIRSGEFIIRVSDDGENWSDGAVRTYEENSMFSWHIERINMQGRYIQFTWRKNFPLIELAVKDEDNNVLPLTMVSDEGGDPDEDIRMLTDEQGMVPEDYSYLNSMYFDEIYHARTGYEQVHGMTWYETTHPPLGKVFMSWCISLLGMTPFAWRLAGTLAGIFMLPFLYALLKLFFRKTELCAAGTILLAVDCMHFAQTRLATIDSFVVLFIVASYYFMFRYMMMSFYHEKFGKTLVPLFFSGLFMGMGVASKWTGIFAGAGLALFFFFTMGMRTAEYIRARKSAGKVGEEDAKQLEKVIRRFVPCLVGTLLLCLVFFVVIPAAIYLGSYYQYLQNGGTLEGVWKYQTSMLSYHQATLQPHPFESPWYTWPLMIRPLWAYYWMTAPKGMAGSISTMGNPLVWWLGLACMILIFIRLLRKGGRRDFRLLLIAAAYLIQLVPWILVPRSTYIYHYFPCVPFLVVALTYGMEAIYTKKHGRKIIWIVTGCAVLLMAVFYPAVSGVPIPDWYARLLQWLPSWTLFWNV